MFFRRTWGRWCGRPTAEADLTSIISIRQSTGQAKEDLRQQSASSLEVEEWVTKAVDLEVVKERLPGCCMLFWGCLSCLVSVCFEVPTGHFEHRMFNKMQSTMHWTIPKCVDILTEHSSFRYERNDICHLTSLFYKIEEALVSSCFDTCAASHVWSNFCFIIGVGPHGSSWLRVMACSSSWRPCEDSVIRLCFYFFSLKLTVCFRSSASQRSPF